MNKHRRKKSKRSHRAYRRNPSRAGEYDEHAARELELFIDNDGQLHRSSFTPIIANLARKMKKGTYNPTMAAKLWAYHVKRGADKYVKEFGSRGDTVSDLGFNKTTRDRLADDYEKAHREQVAQEAGVKYKGEVSPNAKRLREISRRIQIAQAAYLKPKTRAQEQKAKKLLDFLLNRYPDATSTKPIRNPSRRRRVRHSTRRNPAPSRDSRVAKLERMRQAAYSRYQATDDQRHEHAYGRLTDMKYRAMAGDRSWFKGRPYYKAGSKPTIAQIKRIVEANGSHYFEKASMKFFGQRMSDFKVFRSKKTGRIFVGAPSRKQRGYYSLHEFTGKRLNSVHGAPTHWADVPDWVNRQ